MAVSHVSPCFGYQSESVPSSVSQWCWTYLSENTVMRKASDACARGMRRQDHRTCVTQWFLPTPSLVGACTRTVIGGYVSVILQASPTKYVVTNPRTCGATMSISKSQTFSETIKIKWFWPAERKSNNSQTQAINQYVKCNESWSCRVCRGCQPPKVAQLQLCRWFHHATKLPHPIRHRVLWRSFLLFDFRQLRL